MRDRTFLRRHGSEKPCGGHRPVRTHPKHQLAFHAAERMTHRLTYEAVDVS